LVLLNCGYGARGNINYQQEYGWSWVNWDEQYIGGGGKVVDGPSTYCGYSNCLVYAWDTPINSGWKVFSGDINETYGVPVLEGYYCS
jgi:hypothetical protein